MALRPGLSAPDLRLDKARPRLVVNVRGPHGAGKSHFVRAQLGPPWDWIVSPRHEEPLRYTVSGDLTHAAVGHYHNACGGADGLREAYDIVETVWLLLRAGIPTVWLEGMAVSSSYARYAALDDALANHGIPFLWLFLMPTYELAHARILRRNGGRPIREEHLAKKFTSVDACRHKALLAKRWVYELPCEGPQ